MATAVALALALTPAYASHIEYGGVHWARQYSGYPAFVYVVDHTRPSVWPIRAAVDTWMQNGNRLSVFYRSAAQGCPSGGQCAHA